MTQKQLIAYYTANLEKVRAMWNADDPRDYRYIDYAERELNAVKTGGMNALISFWNEK